MYTEHLTSTTVPYTAPIIPYPLPLHPRQLSLYPSNSDCTTLCATIPCTGPNMPLHLPLYPGPLPFHQTSVNVPCTAPTMLQHMPLYTGQPFLYPSISECSTTYYYFRSPYDISYFNLTVSSNYSSTQNLLTVVEANIYNY